VLATFAGQSAYAYDRSLRHFVVIGPARPFAREPDSVVRETDRSRAQQPLNLAEGPLRFVGPGVQVSSARQVTQMRTDAPGPAEHGTVGRRSAGGVNTDRLVDRRSEAEGAPPTLDSASPSAIYEEAADLVVDGCGVRRPTLEWPTVELSDTARQLPKSDLIRHIAHPCFALEVH
jgi:hypothetical protein